jgi:DNA transformation protein
MDRDFLIDLFADFGPVTIRRMFSGFGISADGTNFALALRGGLYFRADEQTIPRFEADAQNRFSIRPGPRPSRSARTGSCRNGCMTIRKS